jgi:hypothetical protein
MAALEFEDEPAFCFGQSKDVAQICELRDDIPIWIDHQEHEGLGRRKLPRYGIGPQYVGYDEPPAKAWNFIDLEKQTFSRCDNAGCDTYPANIAGPTEYLTVGVPGRAVVAELGRTKSDFMEVATLMTTAILSFGDVQVSELLRYARSVILLGK